MTPGPEGLRYDDVPRPRTAGAPEPSRELLERTRLAPFFDAVHRTPVSTIVAPAGFGKSAAVASWADRARAARREVRWVPATDAAALAAALADCLDAAPDAAPNTAPEALPVLVVDDAHRLAPAAVDLLTEHLTRDPGSTRLLLVSRTDLPFVPVGLALSRRAQSLSAVDLRFDADEAAAMVRTRHPDIAAADLERVVEQSEGWAAALALAGSTLRSSPEAHHGEQRVAVTAITRTTIDYLDSQVFAELSGPLQQVLLATCHEQVVTEDEAVVMSGLPAAGELLGQAAERGLLVTRTEERNGGRGPAWRYHPLLVELLRRRTAEGGPSWALLAQAHERAARHQRRLGRAAAALHHAGRSGDVNLQLLVLREFSPELLVSGKAGLVSGRAAAATRRGP